MRPDFGPHFLIATDAEAVSGAESVQLDGIDGFAVWHSEPHRFGIESIAELYCVVLGQPTNMRILDQCDIVFTQDEMHGPWLVSLADEMVKTLSAVENSKIPSVTKRWLEASNDLRLRQAPENWLRRTLEQLVRLALRAVQLGKRMYFESPSC